MVACKTVDEMPLLRHVMRTLPQLAPRPATDAVESFFARRNGPARYAFFLPQRRPDRTRHRRDA